MEHYIKLFEALLGARKSYSELTISERLKQRRADGVKELLEYGYLSTDEAKLYTEQLTELPSDRKGLVVAYYLKGYYDDSQNLAGASAIIEFLKGYGLTGSGDDTIENLSKTELEELKSGLLRLSTEQELQRAETFVDSKRIRIRSILIKPIRARIASNLLPPFIPEDEEELDSTPNARALVIENGYRPEADDINQEDRNAIEIASKFYLDLMELALLNGEAERRMKEVYPKYLTEDKTEYSDTFIYEDETDEVLTELGDIYEATDMLLRNCYNEDSPKMMVKLLRGCFASYVGFADGEAKPMNRIEDDLILGRVLTSKFKYLIDEGLC